MRSLLQPSAAVRSHEGQEWGGQGTLSEGRVECSNLLASLPTPESEKADSGGQTDLQKQK